MKNKKLIILLFTIIFLSAANTCLALETRYPRVFGLPEITSSSNIIDFVKYFFGLGIALSGVLALLSLVVAGMRMITSGGDPSKIGDARDRIRGSIVGIIVLFAAFIILRTINPVLITPTITSISNLSGVYYTTGEEKFDKPAASQEADTTTVLAPSRYTQIKYKCNEGEVKPTIYMWKYPNANFKGNGVTEQDGIEISELNCNQVQDLSVSFKLAFKVPGVYYFSQVDCKGDMSDVVYSPKKIDDTFINNIKSIRIVNKTPDSTKKYFYGAILHDNPDPETVSSCAIKTTGENEKCFSADISSIQSIDVFKINPEFLKSGDGVDFFDEPWGWDTGSTAKKYSLAKEAINPFVEKNPNDITFPNPRLHYENFTKAGSSIQLKGDYLVVLASNNTCQAFRSNITNLSAYPLFGDNPITKISVFALEY